MECLTDMDDFENVFDILMVVLDDHVIPVSQVRFPQDK